MKGIRRRILACLWLATGAIAALPGAAGAQESDRARIELSTLRAQQGPGESGDTTMVLVSLAAIAIGIAGAWSIRERDKDRKNLMRMAMTDDLTNLANRRRLDLDLDHHVAFDSPLAVAMIDIDLFKGLNDRHGHLFGDSVIRDVAMVIDANTRKDDVVYRYGGEEFCVLLLGANEAQAFQIIDRVRRAIAELDYSDVGETVTVSGGVSMGPGHLVRNSLRTADYALLRAKKAGRDRVIRGAE